MIYHNLVTTLKSYLHNSFLSVESSPVSETRSQPRFSLQALPSDMYEEVLSDYYSVASGPTSAQKNKTYEQTQSSSMPFDALKEKSKQSDSEGWEILLVETASKLSDPENNNYGRRLMLENAKKPLLENYKNPFIQDYINHDSNIEQSIVVKHDDHSLDFFRPKELKHRKKHSRQANGSFLPLLY
jgi:hypothetical protein